MELQDKVIDSRLFRDVMGRFATGVTVVSVQENGKPHGMTVNAFCSVSLDPLLVLVSLDKSATTTDMLLRTDSFTVNILNEEQKNIAEQFAQSGNENDRFSGIEYSLSEAETPVIADTLGSVTCNVSNVVDGGDHYIFIGEVISLDFNNDKEKPLLYFQGEFKYLEE